jgi:hypothetical protein
MEHLSKLIPFDSIFRKIHMRCDTEHLVDLEVHSRHGMIYLGAGALSDTTKKVTEQRNCYSNIAIRAE